MSLTRFALPALVLLVAAPAWAVAGAPVPEASDFALFAAGMIGLLIGRSGALGRKRAD